MLEKRKAVSPGRLAKMEETASVYKSKHINNINFCQQINSIYVKTIKPEIFSLVAIDWFMQRGGRPHD